MESCCGGVIPEVDAITLGALAALGIGLTTSLGHCIGMCGPLLSTYSLAQGRTDHRLRSLLPAQLIYHLGRLNAYAVIGLLFGLAGSAVQTAGPSREIRAGLFLFSGLLMVLLGCGLAGWLPTARLVESSRLGRFATRRFLDLVGTRSGGGRYLLGVANGFLPCGPVYAMAIAALAAPTPLHAAGTMVLFGAGTMPVLVAIGLGAGRLNAALQRHFNHVAVFLVLLVGIEFLLRAGKLLDLVREIRWGFLPVW